MEQLDTLDVSGNQLIAESMDEVVNAVLDKLDPDWPNTQGSEGLSREGSIILSATDYEVGLQMHKGAS